MVPTLDKVLSLPFLPFPFNRCDPLSDFLRRLQVSLTQKLVPLLAKIKTKEPDVMVRRPSSCLSKLSAHDLHCHDQMATLSVHEAMGAKVDREAVATLVLPQLWAFAIGPRPSPPHLPPLSVRLGPDAPVRRQSSARSSSGGSPRPSTPWERASSKSTLKCALSHPSPRLHSR